MPTEEKPVPLPQIAAVEVMLAVIGLKPIISREVEEISTETLDRMDKIDEEIASLAKGVVRGQKVTPPQYAPFDPQKAINDLAAGWDVNQVAKMIQRFPVRFQAIGTALIVKSQEVIKQLMEGYPIAQYETLSGAINLKPTDLKRFKFKSVLELVNDPIRVFEFMSTGALNKAQAHAVRTVYPTLSACIDAALFNETAATKATKGADWQIPYRQSYGIKKWLQKPAISQQAAVQAQKNHMNANQRKDAARNPPPPPNQAQATKNMLTSSQRAEAKAAAPT